MFCVVQAQVEPRHLDQLLHPQFANPEAYKPSVLGEGLPASPGAAVGQAVFTAEEADAWKTAGMKVRVCVCVYLCVCVCVWLLCFYVSLGASMCV